MHLSPVNPDNLPPSPKKSSALPWVLGGLACLLMFVLLIGGVALYVFKDDISKFLPASPTTADHTPNIRCPGRHALVKFRTPDTGFNCDVCDRAIPAGTTTFGCRICNWDKCDECATGP